MGCSSRHSCPRRGRGSPGGRTRYCAILSPSAYSACRRIFASTRTGRSVRSRPGAAEGELLVQAESQLQRHLIVRHLAVFDVSAHLFHLEPADISQRQGGLFDGTVDRLADALLGRADDLDDFVDMLWHLRVSSMVGNENADQARGFRGGRLIVMSVGPCWLADLAAVLAAEAVGEGAWGSRERRCDAH